MKKKGLLVLGLLPFLLSACGPRFEGITVEDAKAIIAAYEMKTRAVRKASGTLIIFRDKKTLAPNQVDVPADAYTYEDPATHERKHVVVKTGDASAAGGRHVTSETTVSWFTTVPLLITSSNFYVESEKGRKPHSSDCVYGIIKSRLIFQKGSVSQLYIRERGPGQLSFYVNNSSNELFFKHGLEDADASVDARVDATFDFDEWGYLVHERIAIVNYDPGRPTPKDVYMEVDYVYEDVPPETTGA